MNHDRVDFTSLVLSMAAHVVLVLVLSSFLIKAQPKPVALITDVTLLDVRDRLGEKGEEKKTLGLEKKQTARTATALKKKAIKKKAAQAKVPDTKALLKKIEEEKARLDLGISRDDLRRKDSEEPNISQNDAADDITEENVVAGSEPVITGALATRTYKKVAWKFPEKLPEETELMVEITVLSSGIIKNVKLARTSGYPELDRMALLQARKMQFDPLPYSNDDQVGVLLFKFGAEK